MAKLTDDKLEELHNTLHDLIEHYEETEPGAFSYIGALKTVRDETPLSAQDLYDGG